MTQQRGAELRPLHIVHVYKDYFPVLGGIENHVRVLAEAQAEAGHAVTVLVTSPDRHTREESRNGVRVVKVGRLAIVASTPLSPGLPGALRRLRPDLAHLHAPYPVGELAQLLAGRRWPYVLTYHADATRPVQRAIMRLYGPLFERVLRGAARVLATSPNYAAHSPYLRRVAERTMVVPLGADVARFTPRAGPRPAGQPPILLFTGLLRHYKGLDDLLRALVEIREAHLWVAGTGPMRAPWERLAHELGLAQRVRFWGRVPDEQLPELYRQADVFVLPANSRAEAFGTVLVEAMAAGLPCITTDPGSGTAFVVAHEVTGLVVPPRQPGALAAAARRLLADPLLRARLGAAGRERALREFSEAQMIERVAAVYRQVQPL